MRGDTLKLADFGLAYSLDDPTLSEANAKGVVGTLCYMAPERLHDPNRAYDAAADVVFLSCRSLRNVDGRAC